MTRLALALLAAGLAGALPGTAQPLRAPTASAWAERPALATRTIPVDARASGTVIAVDAAARQPVQAGAVLVRLDGAADRLVLTRAQARLHKAIARANAALAALAAQERTVSTQIRTALNDARIAPPPAAATASQKGSDRSAGAASISQAEAQVVASQARVLRATQALLPAAQQTVARDQALLAGGMISEARAAADTDAYDALLARAGAARAAMRSAQVGTQAARGPQASSAAGAAPGPAAGAASAGVASARARVADARAQVQVAQTEVGPARDTLERDRTLLAEGAVPAKQVAGDTAAYEAALVQGDAAEAALRVAQAQLAAAETTHRQAAAAARQGARLDAVSDRAQAAVAEAQRRARVLAAAQADVASARDAVRAAEASVSRTVVRAPAAGWVAGTAVRPGGTVRQGQTLAWLAIPQAPSEAAAAGPHSAPDAPAARRADPARSAHTAGDARGAVAQLDSESARIRSIVFFAAPARHAGPVPTLAGGALRWPVSGAVSSGYGWRIHPIFHTPEFHTGIDIGAAEGAPVRAAAGGTVLFVGRMPANGLLVILSHGGGLSTTYSHLSSSAVRAGQRVGPGRVIGRVGSTGWSTGPHLFFEVREDGRPVDPLGP